MGTNCVTLIADLLLFLNFTASLSYNRKADIIQALNSTSRLLDDLLYIANPFFEGMRVVLIHLNNNSIKIILMIPKPHFWIYIYLSQAGLFHPKFMIRAIILT